MSGTSRTMVLLIELLSLSVLPVQRWMTNLMPLSVEWSLSKSLEELKASIKCQLPLTDHIGQSQSNNGLSKVRESNMDKIQPLVLEESMLTLLLLILEAPTLVFQTRCSRTFKSSGEKMFMIWIASLMITSAR